jgi:hypothetical protein
MSSAELFPERYSSIQNNDVHPINDYSQMLTAMFSFLYGSGDRIYFFYCMFLKTILNGLKFPDDFIFL